MQPLPKHTTTEPIAHLRDDGTAHLLDEHLRDVGELAARFADAFGASGRARLAGLWHDIGKYSAAFQRRIREENGFEAHVEALDLDAVIRDHSTACAAPSGSSPTSSSGGVSRNGGDRESLRSGSDDDDRGVPAH